MSKRLFRPVFKIEKKELHLVQLFFLYFTTIGIFYTIGATAGDTMFLSRFGASRIRELLPWVYIGTAATSILLTWFYDIVQGRVQRLKLLVVTHLLIGGSIAVFRYLISAYGNHRWLYFCFMIWLESCALISIMLFYSFAGDYFTTRDARRFYGYINGGLALGTLISGYFVSLVVKRLGTDNLLLIVCGCQGLMAVLVLLIARRTKPLAAEKTGFIEERKAPLKAIFSQPYIVMIMFVVLGSLICFRLVEYQFQVTVSRSFQEERLASFFGKFYGYVGIAQVAIQFLLVGWLLDRFGAITSLLILPVCLIGASAGFYFHPMILTAAIMNFLRLAFSETLDLPAREMLFLPLSKRIRLRAQTILSGAIVPLGSGMGGVVLLVLLGTLKDTHQAATVTAALLLFWMLCLLILRPLYRKTLARSLTKKEIGPLDLELLVTAPGSTAVIDELLQSDKTEQIHFALELLSFRKLGLLADRVYGLAGSNNEGIAVRAFDLLATQGAGIPQKVIDGGLADPRTRVRTAAIRAFGVSVREQSTPALVASLDDPQLECRVQAIASLISCGGFDGALAAYPRLDKMLCSGKVQDRAAAAKTLGRIGGTGYESTISRLLEDRSKTVVMEAVLACGELRLAAFVPMLIEKMSDPFLRKSILGTLSLMPQAACPVMVKKLLDGGLSSEDRSILALVIARIGGRRESEVMFKLLVSEKPVVMQAALGRTLRILKEKGALTKIDPGELNAGFGRLIDRLTLVSTAREAIFESDPYCSTLYFDRGLLLLDTLFSLLMMIERKKDLRAIEANLLSADQVLRDNAIELLDLNLPRRLSSALVSCISRMLLLKKTRNHGLAENVQEALLTSDDWLRSITLYHLGKLEEKDGGRKMEDKDRTLFNIISTISFLKTAELFKAIPAEYLIGLAEIVEEVSFFKGETLFSEGDYGDSLYLVREGEISVRKGKKEVARLGVGECIGEMALLDGEPRSATCIIEKDVVLFRISSESFANFLVIHSDVAQALLKTLAQRLRRINASL